MQPTQAEPQPFRPSPSFSELRVWTPDPVFQVRGYVGMRVSWGAIVAGAVALLTTSLILWAFALGVIALATRPTAASLHESMVALYGCAIVTTLIGALVGGAVAGFLRGSPRGPVAVTHGLLAWALAFVLAFGFQLFLMRDLAGTAAAPLAEARQLPSAAAVEPHRHYDPSNAGPAEPAFVLDARDALVEAAGIGWSSFFTWILAGLLAAGGAHIVVRGLIRRDEDEPHATGFTGPMVPTPGE